jgi:hypothetical protein
MLYFFPASLTTNNKGTQQNFRLSAEDVLWIHQIYPKDGGISPDKFYMDTYNMKLEDSISQSKKLSLTFSSQTDDKKSFNWKKILIIIVIVFSLLLIITFIWKIFRR